MAKEEGKPTSEGSAPVDQQLRNPGQEDAKKWSRLVAQAWTDPNLKQRLPWFTPAAVLARSTGSLCLRG